MGKIRDIQGQRFGRLVAGERLGGSWRCICDCAGSRTVKIYNLTGGVTRSCGCLRRERSAAGNATHGATRGYGSTPEYKAWSNAKDRCYREKVRNYASYGGRGITMCARWRHDFSAFLADMGPRPEGRSLDRIDNDGNYEPGNCRWATRDEQCVNRRGTRKLTAFGITQPLATWAHQVEMKPIRLYQRVLRDGWTPEDALAEWSPWGEAFSGAYA